MISNAAQHSIGWFRARLGRITGSQVGLLMKSGRSSDFSDAAKTYIYQVAAERAMNPGIVNDDELFSMYLQQVNINTKAMQWGTEQEKPARSLYEELTGRRVVEVPLCVHPTIPNFASSPDGYYYNENTGEKGVLEIKAPNQATFMRYKDEVKDGASLLSVKPEYYFQCMSHMTCEGATWCDFVVYSPFQLNPIHIVRILPDEKVFAEMEKKIRMADELIKQIID
jgi:hypothetical protein